MTEARIVVTACQEDELKGGAEVWRSIWCHQVRVKPSHTTCGQVSAQSHCTPGGQTYHSLFRVQLTLHFAWEKEDDFCHFPGKDMLSINRHM